MVLTERPAKPQTLSKGHITDFGETWLVRPTHGFGWPAKIFLVWGHPCGRGSPTLGLILLLMAKFHVTAPRGLKWIFSYILVKGLMGNFWFRTRLAIFWRDYRCKKNSEAFTYAIVKASKSTLVTLKWKFSYILVNRLMANFHFWAYQTTFWCFYNRIRKSLRIFFTPMTPSKNGQPCPKLKISH